MARQITNVTNAILCIGGKPFFKCMQLLIELKSNLNRIYFKIFNKLSIK